MSINANKTNISSNIIKSKRETYNNNSFLIFSNKAIETNLIEKNIESNLIAKNINISSKDTKIKASNILNSEKLNIQTNNLNIKEQNLINNNILKKDKFEINADFKINLGGLKAKLGFNKNNILIIDNNIENAKSNILSKQININSKNLISNANIYSNDLIINADKILLTDTKKEKQISYINNNLNLGLNLNLSSPVLDLISNTYNLKDNNITNKFKNARNIFSKTRDITKAISSSNNLSLLNANIGLDIVNINKKIDTKEINSISSNITSKKILLNAKENILLINPKINAEKLNIKTDKLEIKEIETKKESKENTITSSLGLSYNILNPNLSLSAYGEYETSNLNVGLGLNFNQNDKNNMVFNSINTKYVKNNNGLDLTINNKAKLENAILKVNGENYDLNIDLIHKENRLKLKNDILTTFNTPKVIKEAIEKSNKINGNIPKEVRNALFRLNIEYNEKLEEQREEILNTLDEKEKIQKIEKYINEIASMKGEKFSDIKYTNDKNFNGLAATNTKNELIINVNNIDIENLNELTNLIIYETNRWTYDNKELDDLSVKEDNIEVYSGKTKLNVELDNNIDYEDLRYFNWDEAKKGGEYLLKSGYNYLIGTSIILLTETLSNNLIFLSGGVAIPLTMPIKATGYTLGASNIGMGITNTYKAIKHIQSAFKDEVYKESVVEKKVSEIEAHIDYASLLYLQIASTLPKETPVRVIDLRDKTEKEKKAILEYLSGSGGRKGDVKTRHLNYDIAKKFKEKDWELIQGTHKGEEYLSKNLNDNFKKSNYVDMTLSKKIGDKVHIVRINTVSTNSKGQLTPYEANAAREINEKILEISKNSNKVNHSLKIIPKNTADINYEVNRIIQEIEMEIK